MTDLPSVHLAFVSYNRLDYTRKSLESVLADRDANFRLTIWDNASSDGTAEYLKDVDDPRIEDIVLSSENVGQIAAVNSVWSSSTADLLGKLDNDCLLPAGWTRTLATAHRDIPELGSVACWHYFDDDFDYERAKKKIFTYGPHRILRHAWTCGTGLLIKRSTYDELGEIVGPGTTRYWLEMARSGYINGYYYPLVIQEHMDDPKSAHSVLRDEESYQEAKKVTVSLNRHGQHTLDDRWRWRKYCIDNILVHPFDPRQYSGWRGHLRRMRYRLLKR